MIATAFDLKQPTTRNRIIIKMSRLIMQASKLAAVHGDLQATLDRYRNEIDLLTKAKAEVDSEKAAIGQRLGELEASIRAGEEEGRKLKAALDQAREAKRKIDQGMGVLLETLEREDKLMSVTED